jgi:hypothetical protein
MVRIKVSGDYQNDGKIVFETNDFIECSGLSITQPAELPDGCLVEVFISYDEEDFLSGKNGIVWATYDLRQAEILHRALLAQDINTEIKKTDLENRELFLIKVTGPSDQKEAIDFIWKSDGGLNLKPDWTYSENETNKSFEQWLSGH